MTDINLFSVYMAFTGATAAAVKGEVDEYIREELTPGLAEGNNIKVTINCDGKKDDNGIEAYGIFDLSSVKALDKIYIAFGTGNKRNYSFSLSVSDDNINYTPVLTEVKSSGASLDLEEFDLKGAKGRYIKITGHGNQDNTWNNYNEIVITEKK